MTNNKQTIYMSSFVSSSKRFRRYVVGLTLLSYMNALYAGPSGENIKAGTASITRSGLTTTINQSSDKLAIDWDNFDIAKNELVEFLQPSSNALALNRIFDSKASEILGQLNANGKILLINPRGIMFGKDATVDVNSLVATSLMIDTDDFMAGNYQFEQFEELRGKIINNGNITAASGGAIALIGHVIENDGTLTAKNGSIQLIGASDVVLSFDNHDQLGVIVNQEILDNQFNEDDAIKNTGTISAEDGYILVAGHVAQDLFNNAVNHEGLMEATSMTTEGGVIKITGDSVNVSGDIKVDGVSGGDILIDGGSLLKVEGDAKLSAKGSEEQGGFIELFADRVGVLDNASIDASGNTGGGTIHVGGEFQGKGDRNSEVTVVDRDTIIKADALTIGDGGEIILWSDGNTYFRGIITAVGGQVQGDGGFVEVSGKENLLFDGNVDLTAINGVFGSLLLDPRSITIEDSASSTDDAEVSGDGEVLLANSPGSDFLISDTTLEGLSTFANITLEATESITINNLADNELTLTLSAAGGTVTFRVKCTDCSSAFTMDASDTIRVTNGNLDINVSSNTPTAARTVNITTGNLTVDGDHNITVGTNFSGDETTGADVSATISTGDLTVNGSGDVSVTASTANTGAGDSGSASTTVGNVSIQTDGNINITASSSCTGTCDNSGAATVVTGTLDVGNDGNITLLADSLADTGSVSDRAGSASTTAGISTITNNGSFSATASSRDNANSSETTDADVILSGVSIGGTGTITATADSTDADAGFEEQITLEGNYFTNGNGAGVGNITMDGDYIVLSSNTVINTRNLSGTGDTINFTSTTLNSFNGGNFDFSMDAGVGAITFDYSTLTSGTLGTLTLTTANDVWIDDPGATGNDLDISATVINDIEDAATNFTVQTDANISIDDATFTGISLLTLWSDFDNNGSGTTSFDSNATILSSNNQVTLIATSMDVGTGGGVDVGAAGTVTITANDGVDINIGSLLTTPLALSADELTGFTSGTFNLNTTGTITVSDTISGTATANLGNIVMTADSDANNAGDISIEDSFNITTDGNSLTMNGYDITFVGAADNVRTDSGNVTLNATNNVDISGDIDTGDGTSNPDGFIDINAGGTFTLGSNGDLVSGDGTGSGGNITIDAASTITLSGRVISEEGNIGITSTGSTIFQTDNTNEIDADAGTVTLQADGNITINDLRSINSGTAVSVTSDNGGIIDGNALSGADITAASGTVALSADAGIGSGNQLEISAANISATNTTSGNIEIESQGDLTYTGGVTNTAVGGGITLASVDNLVIDANISTNNGAISLAAGNLITEDLTINSGRTINAGNSTITLNAGGDIAVTGLTTTNTGDNAVTITSTGGAVTDGEAGTGVDIQVGDTGRVNITSDDGIGSANALEIGTVVDGDTVELIASNASNNNIDISAQDNLTIAGALTNSETNGTITLNTTDTSDITVNSSISTSDGTITINSADAITMAAAATINSGTAAVDIDGVNDIAITGITSTNSGTAVDITSTSGSITDGGDTSTDITATSGTVSLTAETGIGDNGTVKNLLEVDANALTATNDSDNNSGEGNDIAIAFQDDVTFTGGLTNGVTGGGFDLSSTGSFVLDTNLTTNDGDVALTATTTLTINDNRQINVGDALVNLQAGGDIAITGITSTSSSATAVQVTSTSGSIVDGGETLTDITATNGTVTLTSETGIGDDGTTKNLLEIDANALTATNDGDNNSGEANDIAIAFQDSVTFTGGLTNGVTGGGFDLSSTGAFVLDTNITTTNGTVDLTAATTLTINDGRQISVGNADITLQGGGDVAVTGLITTSSSNTAVSVTSTGGAILDGGDSLVDIDATNGRAVLNSQTGIGVAAGSGADDNIELGVASLDITNDASAGMDVENDQSLSLVAANSNGGDITIDVTGNTNDLTVSGNVQSGGGAITLTADQNIAVNSAVTSSNGNIIMTAGDDAGSDNIGTLTVADTGGNTIDSGSGTIALTADQDVSITDILASNTVTVLSNNGSILDNSTTPGDTDITGTLVSLTASGTNGSIGTGGNALDLSATQLTATANNGVINVVNNQSLQTNAIDSNGAAITIDVTGDTSNLTVASTIQSDGGAITLTADQNITVNDDVTSSNGNIIMIAGDDAGTDTNGTLTVADTTGTTVDSGTGTIALTSDADMTVTDLAATNTITLLSNDGSILDNSTTPTALDINGTVLSMTANGTSGSIGTSGNAFELRGTQLTATSNGGEINVSNSQDLQTNAIDSNGGDITIDVTTNAGSLTVASTIQSDGGAITLTANQDIAINNDVTSSNGNIIIIAGDDSGVDNLGTLTIADTAGFTVESGTGTIALTSDQDLSVTDINASNTVTVTSNNGNILDNSTVATDVDITATGAQINLNASAAVGQGGNALDIRANELSVAAGDLINVITDQALSIISAVTTGASDILTIGVGGDASMSIDGDITANGGIITLTADDDITFGGAHTINSAGGNIVLTANDDGDLSNGGALTMADDSAITAGAGTITLAADENITITGISTTNATGSAVSITSSNGGIRDASTPATDNDITATASGATVTLNAASGVGTLANPIEINVDDIAVTNGTSGDIALNSATDFSVGSLDNSSSVDGGIRLDTQANLTITGTLQTNNQAIVLNAADDVTLDATASLQSNGGAVTVTADSADTGVATDGTGSLLITDGADITSSNGAITLSSAEDATITGLTAGSGNVQVTSSAGNILDSGNSVSDITNTGTVTLTASGTNGTIGTGGNALDLTVNQVAATSNNGVINLENDQSLQTNAIDSNGGDIIIDVTGDTSNLTISNTMASDGGAITLTTDQNIAVNNSVTSSNGNIIMIAGDDAGSDNLGSLTVAEALGTVNSGNGTIALTADEDVLITDILASNTVTILSNNGNILDNSGTATDTDITGTVVTLTASGTNGSIGTGGNAFDLSATQLTATANNGVINVVNDQSLQTNAINSNGGDIIIDVTGDTSNLTAASSLQSGGGAITLTADQNIAVNAAVTSSNGNIIMIAGDDAGTDSNGTLTVADTGGTTINSGSGTIALTGDQDVSITDILASNTVTILSNNGSILDNSTTPGDTDITGTVVTLTASGTNGSIGTGGNALDLSATQLTATANNGVINVVNDQSLQTNAINSNGGDIIIDVTGDTSNLTVASTLQSGGGAITLTADQNIAVNAAVTSSNGNIIMIAGDDAGTDSNGTLTVADTGGTTINSGSGTIALTGDQDVSITDILASNTVTILSNNGSILDNSTTPGDTDITGTVVTLTASGTNGSIGTGGNALDLSATQLTATANNGVINVVNDQSLQTNAIDSNGADITITTTGATSSINVSSSLASDGGLVTLTSSDNLLMSATGAITSSGGNIDLNATAGGALLTMTDGATINSANGNIDIDVDGDTTITGINAGTGTVVDITSVNGSILDGGTAAVDITATSATVTLVSETGIGDDGTTTNALEINAASLAATNDADDSSGEANDIAIAFQGNVNFTGGLTNGVTGGGFNLGSTGSFTVDTDITTVDGDIALNAGTTLTINNGRNVNAGNALVNLLAAGDISVTGVNSDNTSNSAIQITSTGGQILDGGNSLRDISATNGGAVLDAQTNIGTGGDALELSVASIDLSNDAAGVMNVSNDQNLIVTAADNQSGDVSITANSGSDLTVSGNVNSNSGAINFLADGDVTVNNNADITSGGGLINLVADNDTSTAGDILFAVGTSIDAGSANAQLSSADAITLAGITNTNTLTTTANTTTFNEAATIASLSTTSSTINANADLTITGGGLTTTNLNMGNNADLTTAGDAIATTTTIGSAGANLFTTTADGSVQIGNVTGTGANLIANSSGNVQLGAVSLSGGSFTMAVDNNDNETLSSTIASINAGNITIAGSTAQNDNLAVSGDITGNNISISDIDALSLQRVTAGGSLELNAATIGLNNDLISNGLLAVNGATTLNASITMDSNGNATNGGKVDIIGSLDGNGFDLTIDAGSHVACTKDASITNVENFLVSNSIKTVLGEITVNDTLAVNATQEIYLNENVTTGGAVTLDADSDANGNGVVYQLTGRTLNNGGTLTVSPTELLAMDAPANCDLPTEEPTMPQPPEIPPTVTPEVVRLTETAEQEASDSTSTVNDTFLATPPKVTYLEPCREDDDNSARNNCDMDESVRNFLGTFLIDFQLPGN